MANKKQQQSEFEQPIAPDVVSGKIVQVFREQLGHETTRRKMNTLIKEYVGTVEFMKVVKRYASEEMDSRMFRSIQYWLTVVITAIVTSAIGVILGLALSKK